jgi:hypothetical protein
MAIGEHEKKRRGAFDGLRGAGVGVEGATVRNCTLWKPFSLSCVDS